MQAIKSFAEAKRRLDEMKELVADLRQFMDTAESAISAVNTLKGGAETMESPRNNAPAPGPGPCLGLAQALAPAAAPALTPAPELGSVPVP